MFEKVFVVTRKTRLAELVERFNTVGQARFYIEHSGGDFEEYVREDAVYRQAVEVTRRSMQFDLKLQFLDRALAPTVLFREGSDHNVGARRIGCQYREVCEGPADCGSQS